MTGVPECATLWRMSPRYVPQILPGTALTVSTGRPLGSLSFPDAGGFQVLDKAGAILTPIGPSGAIDAVVTDAANNSASTALSLSHALSSGVGANGIGVSQAFGLTDSAGNVDVAATLTVSYTDATSGSEDTALALTMRVGGTGVGIFTLTAPTAGTNVFTAAGSANANFALRSAGSGVASLQGSAGDNIVAVSTVAAASRLGLYGATPVPQAAAITPVGAFTDPPSAAEMAALRTAVNAIITAIGATSGVGITA